MDITRKANREEHEKTLQYRSKQDELLVEELAEEKLVELNTVMELMKKSPTGVTELQRRIKLFGDCQRIEGETSGQFYARLRHWIDNDMPPAKSPLHAPRQTGE